MALDDNWFTEEHEGAGSAFSLQTRQRVFAEQSPYQMVEVFDTSHWGRLMVIDGCTMVSTRDNFIYHEMLSHPALFSHPAPRRVAIIGGGDCGTLREVLRHPEVESVVQIDIDEAVTRAALAHFPELCEANGDPRAQLLYSDGIQWMKDAPAASLDVIMVDSTDPIGPGEVLFTAAFHAACHAALAPGGLVVQQSESPLLHLELIEKMYRSLAGAGFSDARTLFFPLPLYPSGWWSATMGRKDAAIDGFRTPAEASGRIATRYYNADIHRAALAEPEFFRAARTGWGIAAGAD